MRVSYVDLDALQPAPAYPSYDIWYYAADGISPIQASQREQQAIIGPIWDIFHRTIRANANKIVRPNMDNENLGYTHLEEGSLKEIPSAIDIEERFRVPVDNWEKWKAAKADPTLIVVSDYDIGKINIRAEPSFFESSPLYYQNFINLDLRSCKVVETIPGYMSHGKYYVSTLGIRYTYEQRIRVERSYNLPVVPYSLQDILSETGWFEDKSVITSTVAEADSGHLDLLTTAAEFPETLSSIIQGFRTVATMVKDVKKGQLSASKAHEQRIKRLRKIYEREAERLSSLEGEAKTRYAKRMYARLLKQRTQSFSEANKKALDEFAAALASIWLNFRYNIMPAVYTIEDTLKLIESYTADFITGRDSSGWKNDIVLESYGWDPLIIDHRYNCVIKRGVRADLRFSQLTKSNILTTAWELIPLSFVVDWFINIGDILTSISSPNIAPSEGATAGVKYECDLSVFNKDINQRCHYDIKIYRRRVINPMNHIGLAFNADLSWYRKLDALALSWRPIRDLLFRSLK